MMALWILGQLAVLLPARRAANIPPALATRSVMTSMPMIGFLNRYHTAARCPARPSMGNSPDRAGESMSYVNSAHCSSTT